MWAPFVQLWVAFNITTIGPQRMPPKAQQNVQLSGVADTMSTSCLRLMKLEEEDANVAERLRQEERARIAKLEVELARERGLRQLAEQQTKWEQQQPSPLEGYVLLFWWIIGACSLCAAHC